MAGASHTLVTNMKGAGYTTVPAVSVAGNPGGGASAQARLTPTSVLRIDVAQGGSGYVPNVTIAPPLPQAVLKFSGLRPAAEPPTYQVDRRYLPQAFGHLPDGSDGGAFIEFKDAPTGSGKVPKYAVFPDYIEWHRFSNYWFENGSHRRNNVLYLLAANRTDAHVNGWGYSLYQNDVGSLCVVFTGVITDTRYRDDVVVHEIGHRFDLVKAKYPYIDALSNVRSHDDIDYCVMNRRRNRTDEKAEFSLDAILYGSGTASSLRDLEDK